MWTRSELKEKAKAYVKRSYWPLVLVSLILAVITGGFSNGGNSGRDYSTDWSGGVDGGDIASRITGSITGIDWALVGGIMAIAAVFAIAVIAIASTPHAVARASLITACPKIEHPTPWMK